MGLVPNRGSEHTVTPVRCELPVQVSSQPPCKAEDRRADDSRVLLCNQRRIAEQTAGSRSMQIRLCNADDDHFASTESCARRADDHGASGERMPQFLNSFVIEMRMRRIGHVAFN